jgi:hypothetical protein
MTPPVERSSWRGKRWQSEDRHHSHVSVAFVKAICSRSVRLACQRQLTHDTVIGGACMCLSLFVESFVRNIAQVNFAFVLERETPNASSSEHGMLLTGAEFNWPEGSLIDLTRIHS